MADVSGRLDGCPVLVLRPALFPRYFFGYSPVRRVFFCGLSARKTRSGPVHYGQAVPVTVAQLQSCNTESDQVTAGVRRGPVLVR